MVYGTWCMWYMVSGEFSITKTVYHSVTHMHLNPREHHFNPVAAAATADVAAAVAA